MVHGLSNDYGFVVEIFCDGDKLLKYHILFLHQKSIVHIPQKIFAIGVDHLLMQTFVDCVPIYIYMSLIKLYPQVLVLI